jgi:hypothetical protein
VEDIISGLKDKIDIKEKNEYARTQRFHQKTKPENYGHQRRKRDASQRDTQYIQQNNSRNFPKTLGKVAHSGTGSLQENKQT